MKGEEAERAGPSELDGRDVRSIQMEGKNKEEKKIGGGDFGRDGFR